jgi:hypothetical protein
MIPDTGFIIKPDKPLILPSKNPGNPSFSAPFTGCVIKPVIPFENPLKILFAPFFSPSPTC